MTSLKLLQSWQPPADHRRDGGPFVRFADFCSLKTAIWLDPDRSMPRRVHVVGSDLAGAVLRVRVESDEPDADWSVEIRRLQPLDANEARKPMPMFLEAYGK